VEALPLLNIAVAGVRSMPRMSRNDKLDGGAASRCNCSN